MTIDGYDAPITLAAKLTLSKSGIDVDFTGTSPRGRARHQRAEILHRRLHLFRRAMHHRRRTIPNNAGSPRCRARVAPEGCILNAPFPLPVAARSTVGQMLPDVVFGCLRQVRPERCPRKDLVPLEYTARRRAADARRFDR